jgi:acetylornithine deacetylase/succinyl-diaminopimelate desuccinylase-like protein
MFGGIAFNPNRALVAALAKLWDASGKITIPGFYDDVATLTQEELQLFDQSCDPKELEKMFGIRAFQGDGGYSLWESSTIRPTIEINGISGGYTGAGFKTVIPAAAIAKISCRLVPHQDPNKIVKLVADFLQKQVPKGIELTVESDHGDRALRSSPEAPIAKIAVKAYEEVFKKPCRRALAGGSVPIVGTLQEASGGEVALIGVELVDDNVHAPNEHFGLDRLQQGFLVICRIVTLLGTT